MSATRKPPRTRRSLTPRSIEAARASGEEDHRRLERIGRTLEAVQKDLGAIGGSVGTGVRDLRRDVNRLLRDARRDVGKMNRAIQRDLDRLHRHVTSPAGRAGTRRAGAGRTAGRAGARRGAAGRAER